MSEAPEPKSARPVNSVEGQGTWRHRLEVIKGGVGCLLLLLIGIPVLAAVVLIIANEPAYAAGVAFAALFIALGVARRRR